MTLRAGMGALALSWSLLLGCAHEPAGAHGDAAVEDPALAERIEHLQPGQTVVRIPRSSARGFLPRIGDRVALRAGPPPALAHALPIVGVDAQSVVIAADRDVARCLLEAIARPAPLLVTLTDHEEGDVQCPATPDDDRIAPERRTRRRR